MTKPMGEHAEVSPHWFTCLHRADCDEIIKEAEQVAIFSTKAKDKVHISIRDQGWFSCKVLLTSQYEALSPPALMELINGELRFLRTLRE